MFVCAVGRGEWLSGWGEYFKLLTCKAVSKRPHAARQCCSYIDTGKWILRVPVP